MKHYQYIPDPHLLLTPYPDQDLILQLDTVFDDISNLDKNIKYTVYNTVNIYSIEGQHLIINDINAINALDINHHDNYTNDDVPVTDDIANKGNYFGYNNYTDSVVNSTSSLTITDEEYLIFQRGNDITDVNHDYDGYINDADFDNNNVVVDPISVSKSDDNMDTDAVGPNGKYNYDNIASSPVPSINSNDISNHSTNTGNSGDFYKENDNDATIVDISDNNDNNPMNVTNSVIDEDNNNPIEVNDVCSNAIDVGVHSNNKGFLFSSFDEVHYGDDVLDQKIM